MDPAVIASGASVLLSWYYFFVRGDRERGLFVGLWAPTILSFANYFEVNRAKEKMDQMISGGALRRTVQRVVQGNQ